MSSMELCAVHCPSVTRCKCLSVPAPPLRSWGFLCPVHTPDGAPCGLLNHLTRACLVTTDLPPQRTSAPPASTSAPLFAAPRNAVPKSRDAIGQAVLQQLGQFGVRQLAMGMALGPPLAYLTLMLDGLVRGRGGGVLRMPRLLNLMLALQHACLVVQRGDVAQSLARQTGPVGPLAIDSRDPPCGDCL